MLVEHPVALARADKNLKKDIPWISVSAVGMFEGCLADIQRIGPMSEVDIFWTSTGLTCVMWDDEHGIHLSIKKFFPSYISIFQAEGFALLAALKWILVFYLSLLPNF